MKDVNYLSNNLRQSDIDEIKASHNHTPKEALMISLKESIFALTVEKEGVPVAMFGIVPESALGYRASVWLLASPCLDKMKRRFVRHSRKFIEMMLEFYPNLSNFVDVRNKTSIAWLRWLGAKMDKPIIYGVEQIPFIPFSFERSNG